MKILSLPTPLRSTFLAEEQPAVDLLKKSKLAPHHVQVAERLKTERLAARYAQAEFASEIGISRAALANYEYGLSKLSFAVGLLVCERLNLNPRWLAHGKDPKRPYVSPETLGVDPKRLVASTRQRVDFVTGYTALLEGPLESWLIVNPSEILAGLQLRAHPFDLARGSSYDQLEQSLVEFVGSLKVAPKSEKQRYVPLIKAFVFEIQKRLLNECPPLIVLPTRSRSKLPAHHPAHSDAPLEPSPTRPNSNKSQAA